MNKIFFTFLICLTGCIPLTPEQKLMNLKGLTIKVEKETHCNEDDYAKTKYCFSPKYDYSQWDKYLDRKDWNQWNYATGYFGIKTDTINSEPYFVGEYHSNDWLFLKSAKDKSGNDLKFRESDRDVKSGWVIESFFLDGIDMNYLESHRKTGVDIKVYGSKGDTVIQIPGEYIQGFLNWIKNNKSKISEK